MRSSFRMRSTMFLCAWAVLFSASPAAFAEKQGNKGQDKKQALQKLVVIGDSLSAGFQNFSLFTSSNGGQTFGFAAQLAQRAGANLILPTISYPGIPPALTISGGQIVREAGLGSRTNLAQATNLSVPGFTVGNALVYGYPGNPLNPIDGLSDTILGTPAGPPPCGPIPTSLVGMLPLPPAVSSLIPDSNLIVSQVACAISLQPSTVIVSIGADDVLQVLTEGPAAPPTDPLTFQTNYHLMMQALALTHANIIVSNVPDVTQLPFVVTAAAFQKLCPGKLLPPGDDVVPSILDFSVCTSMNYIPLTGPPGTLSIAALQGLVATYNQIIAGEVAMARAQGVTATVVDINGLLNNLSKNGYSVGNHHLTTAFLGGLFSLDGIHPTNTGYAIMANAFITSINSALNMNIPQINIESEANHDPLVP